MQTESLAEKRARLDQMLRNLGVKDLDLIGSRDPFPEGVSARVRAARDLQEEIRLMEQPVAEPPKVLEDKAAEQQAEFADLARQSGAGGDR